jgi:hypothetical protein
MGKASVFLMALVVALAAAVAVADATPPGLRRSRFLAEKLPPPISYTNCNNQSMICEKPGSPGNSCCNVCDKKQAGKQNCNRCVDVKENFVHCGACGAACKYGETCCNGKCVDLLSDWKNCGECGFRCHDHNDGDGDKGCIYGFCDYAG